jgi:DEAD/DEAH box helicase domain-containing protein
MFIHLIIVTAIVFGYFKVDKRNNIMDAIDVDNPPVIINTRGMWLDVPPKALEILSSKSYNMAGSIHAAEHAILSLLPNVVITSPGDVRTECKAAEKEYARVLDQLEDKSLMLLERNSAQASCQVFFAM